MNPGINNKGKAGHQLFVYIYALEKGRSRLMFEEFIFVFQSY
jgi:hypothetical protein